MSNTPRPLSPTHEAPAPETNIGVWFQSAASGLWYRNTQAAVDVAKVRIDGFDYNRQPEDMQALRTCRDHWQTSFQHERENVIRLRGLLARAHGAECICADCHITRFKTQEAAPL